MTKIVAVQTVEGKKEDLLVDDNKTDKIDGEKLTVLPAMIDPHVHFRTPGHEYKENWISAAKAALAGGVTTVMDMPNNDPACIDQTTLINKHTQIREQLIEANIPLRYYLHLGATAENCSEYELNQSNFSAIKIFMGSSTGNLLVNKEKDLDDIFAAATKLNKVVMVHAEDDEIINNNHEFYKNEKKTLSIEEHSKIRSPKAAAKSVQQAIKLAAKHGTALYICHVSTAAEIKLIEEAKKQGVSVYCEVTPHHLFLSTDDYKKLGTKAQMNPPLRDKSDQDALWQAINDNIVDTIGTDHAPHTLDEKNQPYGKAPSGVPGIETYLPLLLNAYHEKKITLKKIIELTSTNIKEIFSLPEINDKIIVDSDQEWQIKNSQLKTKCKWSPFAGTSIKGKIIYTILNNKIYHLCDI